MFSFPTDFITFSVSDKTTKIVSSAVKRMQKVRKL